MPKLFLQLVLFLGLIFNVVGAEAMENKKMNADLAGITKALDRYVEAAVKGDSKIAEAAFAPLATMSYAENGKLVTVPIKELYNYFDKTGPHEAFYDITSVKIAGDVAVVSIESKFGDAKFDDMFTLVKDGDNWKIVSKVYHLK